MIKFVWAEDANHGIGYEGHLPWHMPADMKHFKDETIGHPILMGRKTFDSFPHLLPKRKHLVLTRDQNLAKQYQDNDQVEIFSSIEKMKDYLKAHKDEEISAIGGVSIFKALLDEVDQLEKTEIEHEFEVDTYMPEIDYSQFELVKKEAYKPDEKNKYPYTFFTYVKKNNKK